MSQKVKEETKEVYLGGVRLWKNETLTNTPTESEKDTDIGKFWYFLLELVGHGVDSRIEKLELINLDSTADKCECDAALEDNEDKLKHPCSCKGSGAIVTFKMPMAAGTLAKQLGQHKSWHSQGYSDRGRLTPDGSVEFCPLCCFKNKQVKHVRKKPVAGIIHEEEPDDDPQEKVVTEEQAYAFRKILLTVLGLRCEDYIDVIMDATKELKLGEARDQIKKSVKDILHDPRSQEDIPEKPKEEVEKIIESTIKRLILKKPDKVDPKEVKEWMTKYQKTPELITVESDGEEEVEKEPPNPPSTSPPATGIIEPTEENLKEAIGALERVVRMAQNATLTIELVEHAKGTERLLTSKVITVEQIFTDLKEEIASRYEVEVTSKCKTALEAKVTLSKNIKLLELENGIGKFGSAAVSVEKQEDVPTNEEIKDAISLFTRSQISFNEGKEEIEDMVNAGDLHIKRVDFDVVTNKICPSVDKILEKMTKTTEQLKKWRRLKTLEVSSSIKKSIDDCVTRGNTAQEEWHALTLSLTRLDRQHQLSRKAFEPGGANLIGKNKIETFYGEEPGKKWQNLFDWLSQVELNIIPMIHDKQTQVNQVITLLSPRIAQLAKVEKFESYEVLKEWLVKNYVNEVKVVREWQNKIGSLKPTKWEEVKTFVAHTKGVLAHIKEYCQEKTSLKNKLFSDKNIVSLTEYILNTLSVATKRDENTNFIFAHFTKDEIQKMEKGVEPGPEEMLAKLEDYLSYIAMYSIPFTSASAKKHYNEIGGPREEYRGENNKYEPNKKGKGQRKGGGASGNVHGGGAGSGSANYILVSMGTKNVKFGTELKMITSDKNRGSQENEKIWSAKNGIYALEVKDIQEALERAKEFERKSKNHHLPCWMNKKYKFNNFRCNWGSDGTIHEVSACRVNKNVSNFERFKAARDRGSGPGIQCFTCLSAMCFLQRCLEVSKSSNPTNQKFPPCNRYGNVKDFLCIGCVNDVKRDPSLAKGQKPMHALICPKKEHKEKQEDVREMMRTIKNGYQQESDILISLCIEMAEEDVYNDSNCMDMSESDKHKRDKKTVKEAYDEHVKKQKQRYPEIIEISESEYKGAKNSALFDTKGGKRFGLDLRNKEILESLKRASPGRPLYFMQQFNLNGQNCLVFYDTGAMFNLIQTQLARKLGLKMVSRKSMYVIGAGNNVHSSGDGKYEIILGRGKVGEKYVLEVAGSRELTNIMVQADFTDVHAEVREIAQEFADNGQVVMEPNEVLPEQVAGMAVKMIIGMTTPTLQPQVIFSLPSGLLVAKVKLVDTYGSNIVFGGMFGDYKRHFEMHYAYRMAPETLLNYTQYHKACFEEYLNFRDSLRVDKVYFKNGREMNEAWSEVIEKETDEMMEEAPLIIAGSEEKRGVQLHRMQVLKQLINAGEEIIYQKDVHKNIEPMGEEMPVKSEDCIMNPTIDGGMYKLKMANKNKFKRQMKHLCPFNEGAVGEVYGNNIMLANEEKIDATKAKIDELVNDAFGIETKEIPSREGVYFENVSDKAAYYNSLAPDLELEELMKRESSVEMELGANSNAQYVVPPSGMAKMSGQKDGTTIKTNQEPECTVDHGCHCNSWTTDQLLTEVEDDLSNIEAKQWQKLKKALRKWEDDETLGTGIDFRCSKCLRCKDCLRSGKTRARSQREEDEQRVIESSVRIDWEKKQCFVFLPWIKSPQELALKWGAKSNIKQAMHFLKKMLQKSQDDRDSLTRFWEELKNRDVVRRLKDLDEDIQKSIMSSPVIHYYPWNCVFKESITTPCRMVVDSRTSGLNEHLAKGLNTLNNLQQLLLRFRSYEHIGSYDISKMYNMLFIEPSHLQYQLILWVDEMDPKNETEVWVMMRAIYGTISSGNQAEVAIRRGASVLQDKYPEGAHTIIEETYVDDGIPCRDCPKALKLALEEVELILNKIGFALKCVTFSGQKTELSKKASSDGLTIGIAGYKYQPGDDLLSLAMKECNFNPIRRGVKAPNKHPVDIGEDIDDEIFPTQLTRAQAVGKLAEMYDLTGIFMPVCMIGKILARQISHLEWADYVPEEMLDDWRSICKKIQDVRHIKVNRCILPKNAKNPKEVDLMEIHDGSQHSSATAVYARCELKDGSYSTRMLFSRSSLCPKEQCIPRNELQSSHLGATASYITALALKGKVRNVYTFGDSMVALLWVVNKDLKLKSWVFARVQDIHRLNDKAEHYWIKGVDNIADKATKGQVTVTDVNAESVWQNGLPWMHMSMEEMKTTETILNFEQVMSRLNAKDKAILAEEQNPSLPDLATGARRNSNPEFDIMYTTPSLREGNIMDTLLSYCGQIGDTKETVREEEIEGEVLMQTQKSESVIREFTNEPENQFLAGSYFGINSEMATQLHVNYPPNFSCLPSGKPRVVREEYSQIRRFPIDITRHGWKVTYRTTSIWIHWMRKTQHKAHQIPVEGHHLYGNPKMNPEARKELEKSCKICHKEPKVDNEGINLGYLDSLCSGKAPTVTREDQILRKPGNQDWLPKWKNGVNQEVINNLHQIRSKTRSGWDGKAKISSKPAKKARKAKKTNETEKINAEIMEEIRINDEVKVQTWKYFMRKASEKVTEELSNKDKEKFEYDEDERIWKFYGRLLARREIEVRDYEFEFFHDSSSISFIHPVGLATDPLIFQILLHFHWEIFSHKGTGSTNRIIAQFLYVIRGGYVVKAIRDGCQRCRRILKKHIKTKMGDVPLEKLMIAPAFSYLQADTAGPFPAYSRHNQRSTVEVNCLVLVCIVTGAVSLWALENLEAPSIVKAMLRHSTRYGFPVTAYCDKGPGLQKGLRMRVDITDFTTLLRREIGMNIVAKPTHSHESRGKVERTIKVLKNYLEDRKLERLRQSILDWETSFGYVANYLNNLPMSRLTRNRSMTYDITEIITANRLLLGRNNFRNLNHIVEEQGITFKDRLGRNDLINKSWQTLLHRLVPDLCERPKWHKTDLQPEPGDYVLFCHLESKAGPEHEVWKVGMITRIEESASSPSTLKYFIEYRQVIKQKDKKPEEWKVAIQETDRHLRDLVLLFTESELRSAPGSEEHLKRLARSLTSKPKGKKRVRFKDVPTYMN